MDISARHLQIFPADAWPGGGKSASLQRLTLMNTGGRPAESLPSGLFCAPAASYRIGSAPRGSRNGSTACVQGVRQRVAELFLIPAEMSNNVMNNNYLTTTAGPAPGRGVRSAGRAQAWLSARCEFPSRLLEENGIAFLLGWEEIRTFAARTDIDIVITIF